jgi:hypothetical protein
MANQPIYSAKNIPLSAMAGTMPDLSDALLDWFAPMTFSTVVKTVVNFQVQEVATPINFLGVWQPLSPQKLLLKPEGQRAWLWFTVHAQPGLELVPDEVITYLGTQYRVMQKLDWKLDGYVEYHLVNNYVGSGPL